MIASNANRHAANAHYELGVALSDQGQTEEAITEYRIAIALDPHFADAHRNLSELLRQQGKEQAADAELKIVSDLEQKTSP